MYYPDSFNRADWGWHILFGLIWLVIVIVGIVFLVRMFRDHNFGHYHRDPQDIIKERYARGEINKAEFDQLKKDL